VATDASVVAEIWLLIRRAAGIRAAHGPDPDAYEQQYAHCDVLVIGGGATWLRPPAAHAGARVIVCDENPAFGGGLRGLRSDSAKMDGKASAAWIDDVVRDLSGIGDVTLLPRTTAFGYYDGNLVGLHERITDHLGAPVAHMPRQRNWKVRAKSVVLASGAHERAIAYANNDLPGTLLAGAARTYVDRHAVKPGTRAVVFTNNDSAYAAALSLSRAGVPIGAIVDARAEQELTGALVMQATRRADSAASARRALRAGSRCDRSIPWRLSLRCPAEDARASIAILSACRVAGIPPCTCSHRRAEACATMNRSRPSFPTGRRCRS
jgi:hypothetical protein